MGLLLSLLFFSNVPLPSIPEPLITASVLTWTATVHHINVSFDQADVWESIFLSCELTCLRHSDSFHLTMCMCVHAKKNKKSDVYITSLWHVILVCVLNMSLRQALCVKLWTEWGRQEKAARQVRLCLSCKPGQWTPHGEAGIQHVH